MNSKENVFCIHGLFGQPLTMRLLVHNWAHNGKESSIEEHTDALVEDLRKIAAMHPNVPIHFCAHSLGGVILRAALNHPKCPPEASRGRAVLVASPQQGSSFATWASKYFFGHFFLGKSGAQLATTSLEHYGQFPKNMPLLVVFGETNSNPILDRPNDGTVTLDETIIPGRKYRRYFIPWGGHTAILFRQELAEVVGDFIGGKEDIGEFFVGAAGGQPFDLNMK